MKRIGIVTFHRSHNCGSILQAYAMQKALADYGYHPEFIDLSTEGQQEVYSVFKPFKINTPRNFAKSLYKNSMAIMLFRRLIQNRNSYEKFISKHLSVSTSNYSRGTQLIEKDLGYDLYLTGSDQVWNVTISDYDDAYFLPFVKDHLKIAYAVSQGAKDLNKYANDLGTTARYIKRIEHVSTRESNGQAWLKNLTGNDYPVVLDPTLLHDRAVYSPLEEVHSIRGLSNGGYIFIYATPLSRTFMKLIRKYAKAHSLDLVIWHNDVWLKRLGMLKGVKSPESQTPGKYLDLIKNAKFVCTSSFHGVAFSTIYRKNFVVLENEGMRAGDDDRMTGFLRRLKLSDRIVNHSQFNAKMNETIDYTNFEEELDGQQRASRSFLEGAVGKKA